MSNAIVVMGDVTEGEKDAVPVPAGWELLPAGEKKEVRANRKFIADGKAGFKPFLIRLAGSWGDIACSEVRVLGPAQFGSAAIPAHCGNSSVWLETDGPILVRK